MQFQSEANGLDLYTDARYKCGIETGDDGVSTPDTTSYPIKAFTRNANFALDRTESLILKADGWKFDDTNQSGQLIDTSQTFTTGTSKVSVQATWLGIERVRITDQNGNFVTLPYVDRRQLPDSMLNATSGLPSYCYRLGNYLYFDKPTSYSGTVEVQFQRGASYFTYTDTTKTPGFAPAFHRLVSLHAAKDWCSVNAPERVSDLLIEIGSPPDLMNGEPGSGMEKELVDYYSRKDAAAPTTLSPQREDYGALGLSSGLGTYPTDYNPMGFL